jgi:uncharacterized RDD family membrane protein YckC
VPAGTGSQVSGPARPYQGREAGVVTRAVAGVVDGIVVALVLLLLYGGLAGFLFVLNPRSFTFPDTDLIFGLLFFLGTAVVYLGLSWWLNGRSYGDAVMGLRVVSGRGGRLSLWGSLLRAWLCCVFPVGLLWAVVSRRNRSVQDVLLRTRVVYDWSR